ncbi:hypothetical protein [Aliiglaciecola sp. LCG003]|uniref:hypothetical protein n=1 Tax=Aliiglaciecola sp. LCG003 TaxID=3053655 RepID=UPI002572DA2B|nr:hypothetical protein [Aliiglaciecola sp. LCG003]WJG09880.1 hypothetical protein QR722_02265 [Aliiglaciecola sp. LCG003]
MIKRILFFALILSAPLGSNAAVIDFEGVVPDNSSMIQVSPYSEDGFILNSSRVPEPVDGIFGANAVNSNGSAVFGWCLRCGIGNMISVAMSNAKNFNLLSFDFSNLDLTPAMGIIEVTGYLSSGGSVTASVDTSNAWVTESLNWTGLTKVDFFGRVGADSMNFNPALDNLVVQAQEPAQVPTPAPLALLGLGLVALALTRRRNIVS